jgi:hypothetical protein
VSWRRRRSRGRGPRAGRLALEGRHGRDRTTGGTLPRRVGDLRLARRAPHRDTSG